MSLGITPYQIQNYLNTPEDRAAYLDAVVHDDGKYTPELLPVAIGDVIKAVGVAKVSEETGLNRESLYKAFSEKGNPTYSTLSKVLHALGVDLNLIARSVAH
jgi:probable addiction module antidote protein